MIAVVKVTHAVSRLFHAAWWLMLFAAYPNTKNSWVRFWNC